MKIGLILKQIRESWSITQKEMAERCSVNQSTYSLLERGVSDIGIQKLKTLIDEYDINPNFLFYGAGNMYKPPPITKNTVDQKVTKNEAKILQQYREWEEFQKSINNLLFYGPEMCRVFNRLIELSKHGGIIDLKKL